MSGNLSNMTWWEYVERTAPEQTQEQIARRVNVSNPTVGRWKTSTPKPESAAAFARAYGRPVIEAFVVAGFLTPEEARAQVTITRQEELSDDTLLDLLARRLRRTREDVTDHAQRAAPITHARESLADEYDLSARGGESDLPPAPRPEDESQDQGGDEPA